MTDYGKTEYQLELELRQMKWDAARMKTPPANLRGRRKIGHTQTVHPQAPAPWQR